MPLLAFNVLLVTVFVIHTLDHARQARPLPAEVTFAGAVAAVTAVGALVLTLGRSRFAAIAAAVVGSTHAAGLILIHLLPRWSDLSDPFAEAGVDGISWALLVAYIATGTATGIAGFVEMRHAAATSARVRSRS